MTLKVANLLGTACSCLPAAHVLNDKKISGNHARAVYDSVSLLPFLPGSLGKKMSPLKGTLGKIEQVLYELALLSQGVSLKPSEDADE